MKIMIVEDERTIGDMVAEALGKWGFETVQVEEFDQVLQLFVRENPHLVLMDINLPAFDGFYWCNQIREVSKVPILFISSRNTPIDMVMSMNMGGDDFIQKPFYTDVLVAKINALLRRTYSYMGTSLNVIEHDGILLSLNDGHILSGEQKAELTKTEFTIMKILMQHKGTVVTRKKIMRSLWEDESFVDDNTLTVNMTRLRKKLAELGKAAFISTRKGEGYIIS
ncbi:response regulator transcription factor [Paenibacillus mendelii]|uniref:Response regulator transcription factor n=1 Tax=Paenibacillus mendelii TaxID=206163 RepID=A0ABV6J8B0_9BACL|nr:response regulator transcription factor [Paenibacillus mendelii]MCQ6561326.1 response regulator transcription factor [Paenibacillus mendelii]